MRLKNIKNNYLNLVVAGFLLLPNLSLERFSQQLQALDLSMLQF